MRKSTLLLLLLLGSLAVFAVAQEEVSSEDDAGGATTGAAAASKEPDLTVDGFSTTEVSDMEKTKESHEFQAEVSRLMDIIINSLYSNREVFLRELISNASDALDKIRYLSLTDKAQLGEGDSQNLEIRIRADKKARTLTIHDKGVGMTKHDLIHNLGTVASSGTTKFAEAAGKGGNDALALIGQFGVGFYSVYLVADTVTVITKHNEDKQYVWHSNANRTYTVSEDPRGNTVGRGTQIILHLKEDASEFLDQHTLERLIGKYSEFINFPILLETTKNVEKEVPADDEEAKSDDETKPDEEQKDDVEVTDEEEKKEKPKTKKVVEEVSEWKQVNENKAIWTRDPKDVTSQEYDDFYKAISKDNAGSLTFTHFKAEGEITFKSILYIPKNAPSDLYDKYYSKSNALKLYVRRVLISDEFEDFMPRYLSFIKGVVDSDDLPLNVSRETLSKNKVLKVIGKKLTRKAIDLLRKMADDAEKYEEHMNAKSSKKEGEEEKKEDEEENKEEKEKEEEEMKKNADKWYDFWKAYGKSIKLGVIEDSSNKNKLQKLLRFVTSKSNDKPTTLDKYVERMKESQRNIYYITGESLAVVKKSPFLEKLTKRGFEVILMVDPLDEYLMANMQEYDNKRFVSITKEGLKLEDESDEERSLEESMKAYYQDLTVWLKELYGDKVEKVVISNRITESPAVLVTGQYGWSANMERIMKAQTLSDTERQSYMMSKRTMEINPRHPMMKELKQRVAANPSDSKLKDLANMLYDSTLISSGFTLDDVVSVSQRINRIVSSGLDVAADAAPVPDSEFPIISKETESDSSKAESTSSSSDEQESSHDDL